MQILKDKLHIMQVICKDKVNTVYFHFDVVWVWWILSLFLKKDLWRNSIILSWPLDGRQEEDYSSIQQTCCCTPGVWNDTSHSLDWWCRSFTIWPQCFIADHTPKNKGLHLLFITSLSLQARIYSLAKCISTVNVFSLIKYFLFVCLFLKVMKLITNSNLLCIKPKLYTLINSLITLNIICG